MFLKNSILILVACFFFSAGFAQNSGDYKAEADGWLVDVEQAYNESKKTGKPIMANFTGSDWCGWCKKLKASVFVKDDFKAWAKDNVVLLELDFPRRKQLPEKFAQQNQGLQRAFNVRGFPTIWVFDLDWDDSANQFGIKALGKTGYSPSTAEFTANVNKMIEKRKTP